MKTWKLWLEPDPDIPEFKRLHFIEADATVQEVLRQGIHPDEMRKENPYSEGCKVNARLIEILNLKELKIPGLTEFGYCNDLSESAAYYFDRNDFAENIQNVADNVYFVEEFDYPALLSIARRRVAETWSHIAAVELAKRVYPDFNKLREFLKKKDKSLKLSGYGDIDNYRMDHILKPVDFAEEDKALIACGIPRTNFRKTGFLKLITIAEGYPSLVKGFERFIVIFKKGGKGNSYENALELSWYCRRKSDEVLLMPDIDDSARKRELARSMANLWGKETGKYCFSVSLDTLAAMLEKPGMRISFEDFCYLGESVDVPAQIKVKGPRIERYTTGEYLTAKSSNEMFQDILRNHGISMTGRKEELVEKLSRLAARLYEEKEPVLREFFQNRKFIKVPRIDKNEEAILPVLEELDMGGLLRAMFVMRHLRANVILDAAYENTAYELIDLARALIDGKVSLDGVFIQVEHVHDQDATGGDKNADRS